MSIFTLLRSIVIGVFLFFVVFGVTKIYDSLSTDLTVMKSQPAVQEDSQDEEDGVYSEDDESSDENVEEGESVFVFDQFNGFDETGVPIYKKVDQMGNEIKDDENLSLASEVKDLKAQIIEMKLNQNYEVKNVHGEVISSGGDL